MIKAVQYHPNYCEAAKADAQKNGHRPWRWDSSHDLSIVDSDGTRRYIGQYRGSDAATKAGEKIEREGLFIHRPYTPEERRAPDPARIEVLILTMKLSGDREEYYVRIKCGERTHETNKYSQNYYNRALYERDCLRAVLLGDPRPELMAPQYADKNEKDLKS